MKMHLSPSEISFFVPGIPCRKPFPVTVEQGSHSKEEKLALANEWTSQINLAAKAWKDARLDGPLELTLCFWLPRPPAHFTMGSGMQVLRDDAPKWHLAGPTSTALAQLIIETLDGLYIWNDACQLCAVYVVKGYSEPSGCQVSIVPIEDNITCLGQ